MFGWLKGGGGAGSSFVGQGVGDRGSGWYSSLLRAMGVCPFHSITRMPSFVPYYKILVRCGVGTVVRSAVKAGVCFARSLLAF